MIQLLILVTSEILAWFLVLMTRKKKLKSTLVLWILLSIAIIGAA